MKKTLVMTLGLVLAMCAGSVPSFAGDPSIPAWSGPPIATPGDDGVGNVNGAVNTHNHLNVHGQDVSDHSR